MDYQIRSYKVTSLPQKIIDKTISLSEAISTVIPYQGITATEIAEKLGLDKSDVASHLYKNLGILYFQDNRYRWYLRNNFIPKNIKKTVTGNDMSRICSYYLDCISQSDESGYGFYASDKFGIPDYIDVLTLPSRTNLAEYTGSINTLRSKMRQTKGRKDQN